MQLKSQIATILVLLLASWCDANPNNTFHCGLEPTNVYETSGFLSITREAKACGFKAMNKSKSFSFRVDNLKLDQDEYVEIIPGIVSKEHHKLTGPLDAGFVHLVIEDVTINFNFKRLDESVMLLEFVQDTDTLPINIDVRNELTIKPYGTGSTNDSIKFQLSLVKSIPNPVHIQLQDQHSIFDHQLIESSTTIKVDSNQPVLVKMSPARGDCFKSFSDNQEISHEITGPEATTINSKYRCVNLFATTMPGQAHYDVDFSNFLDIVDTHDELIIDDGSNALKITRYTAKNYDAKKPTISFRGNRLAVIYDSPVFDAPRTTFKLTVNAKARGGIVEKSQALALPAIGEQVQYSLRPQSNEPAVLLINGALQGVNIQFSNGQNVVSLEDNVSLPPVIVIDREVEETNVNFMVKSKVSGAISYKEGDNCGGSIFSSSGYITSSGLNKTCHWLIGRKSLLTINYHNFQPGGCLSIRPLSLKSPLYKRCDIRSIDNLPKFVLEPSYLEIVDGKIDAVITPDTTTQVTSVTTNQRNISSTGYPDYYFVSDSKDAYVADMSGKSAILSLADIDIRTNEDILVDDKSVISNVGDIDISNRTTNLVIKRPLVPSDFRSHRGYLIRITEYQTILHVSAGPNQTALSIPKNTTSVLIIVTASQSNRLSYDIDNLPQGDGVKVYDANSLSGRLVYDDERNNGSTTSNTLLISLMAKSSLPEVKVLYGLLPCNATIDHFCDGKTRCVPADKLCKGRAYCQDGSDLKIPCSSGPQPKPEIIEKGVSGLVVFILAVLMFSLGAVAALYGPDAYKNLEGRFRSGQYTTFTSTE